MWIVEEKFRVIIGGNTYINCPKIIVYKGESLFSLKRRENDGQLGIDFDIFDKDGKRVATIRGNRIVQGNEDDYTIVREANRYTVTEKATGRVICDIKRRSGTPHSELEVSVKLYTSSGFLVDATPTMTNLAGMHFQGCVFENAIAINIT